MTVHERPAAGPSLEDDIYSSSDLSRTLPKTHFPHRESNPRAVYAAIRDELMLDGNSRQNLATFCQTWEEPQIHELMDLSIDKNMIDKDEYPQTAELERRCVHMLADLWHAPDAANTIGASAIGSLPQGYVQNAPDFGAYNRAIDANEFATVRGYALNADDRLRALVIEKLMCGLEVDLDGIADRFGAPSSEFHSSLERIEPLESAGLVNVSGHRLQVTERGRPFVRLVAAAFDAHLSRAARHSAAI